MRAIGIVEAIVGDQEIVEDLAIDDGTGDDPGDILGRDRPIPDALGVNDHDRPVLALVEAAGVIGPGGPGDPGLVEFLLEEVAERLTARGIAASTRVVGIASVAADEDLVSERGHFSSWSRKQSVQWRTGLGEPSLLWWG
jgi:hypothetical protein